MNARALLLASVAAVLAAGCGGGTHSRAPSDSPRAGVTELRSIEQLRSAFAAHDGTPRLLLLASPT